jgi:hypothetical protein
MVLRRTLEVAFSVVEPAEYGGQTTQNSSD